jgi:hypothetical protein
MKFVIASSIIHPNDRAFAVLSLPDIHNMEKPDNARGAVLEIEFREHDVPVRSEDISIAAFRLHQEAEEGWRHNLP